MADLAGIDFFLYDFAAAEAGFAAALDLARTLNYRRVEMVAQDGLSGVLRLRGDYTQGAHAAGTGCQHGGRACLPL